MKGDAGNGIFNDTVCFIASCHAADVHLAGNRPLVNQSFIISRNRSIVPAGDAAYIVIPGDGGRFIVDQIGQGRTGCIVPDETAYVLAAGDFPVVAAVGDAAAVGAYQAAYIVTGLILFALVRCIRFPGYTGCIGNIFDILPCIYTEDAAYIITAADDAFVVGFADRTAVPAGNTADVVRILRSYCRIMAADLINPGSDTETVHIAQGTVIDTGDAAQSIGASCTGIDCAVAAAVGNLILINSRNAAGGRKCPTCSGSRSDRI